MTGQGVDCVMNGLYAVGGNEQAARAAGISVPRIKLFAYGLCGLLTGLAGVVLAARITTGQPNAGQAYELDAIAAVVIGGVSLKGGVGKLPGVYAGVLLLSSIHTAINLMGLPAHYTQVILGLLVLAAVLLDTLKLQIRQRFA